jgi:excisionase family DNA binding protein
MRDRGRTPYQPQRSIHRRPTKQTVMIDKSDDALVTLPAKVMTLEEASHYLHVHPSTLYRLLKRGEIPAFRIGSDWRFNIEAIDLWRSKLEMKR